MIQRAFQHRSGRVISLSRALLAGFFLLAIWMDSSQPALAVEATYALLIFYAVLSAGHLLLTWNNWWLECRLAGPAHIVDLIVFTGLMFATEGYTSPFFTFFVFLILSATIRWGWRETALTALAVIILYFAAALSASTWNTEAFELRRFMLRSAYLVVLSMILIWFGVNQRALRAQLARADQFEALGASAAEPARQAMDYAARRFGARRVVFAWSESEEPWLNISCLEDGRFDELRLPPGSHDPLIDPWLDEYVLLFDCRRNRVLLLDDQGRRRRGLLRGAAPVDRAFAERFGIEEGLLIPISGHSRAGHLFLLDVPGLCSDDLPLGSQVGEEIVTAFERAAMVETTEEAAATRARLGLARDLHDSVMQFLAGMALKLEGVRKTAQQGADAGPEIDELQEELTLEQRDLRGYIVSLRGSPARPGDVVEGLRILVDRLARQWSIHCTVASSPHSIEAPARLQQDVHLLVREAIANAVRHGKADRVSVAVDADEDMIRVEVVDNGAGFPAKVPSDHEDVAGTLGPWSLHERVQSLGGDLVLTSGDKGSKVSMSVPMRNAG